MNLNIEIYHYNRCQLNANNNFEFDLLHITFYNFLVINFIMSSTCFYL